MRYLVLANTPAHVHLYRHLVTRLRSRGHEALVLARDYGPTLDLLAHYELPHEVYGACGTSRGSLFRRLPGHFLRIARAARRFDPDVVFGLGSYAAVAGTVTRAPTVLVVDSEPTTVDHAVSRRLASALLTPAAFRKDLGPKQYRFRGFKECAYLHPSVFERPADAAADLGVGDRYAVVRLNAFGSHHDVGEGGFDRAQRRQLVRELATHLDVVVSDEGGDLDVGSLPATSFDLHPARIHDALAGADLLVADTQTMVTEAALLGTPALRSNSFVGADDMGNFLELERAGLVENLASFEAVRERAVALAADPGAADRWRRRWDDYVAGLADLTDLLVTVAERGGDPDGVAGLRPASGTPGGDPVTPARDADRADD